MNVPLIAASIIAVFVTFAFLNTWRNPLFRFLIAPTATLALLYPYAKVLQMGEFGPEVIRFWGGDLGFVPFGATLCFQYIWHFFADGTVRYTNAALKHAMSVMMKCCVGVLLLAFAAETVQLLLFNANIDLSEVKPGDKLAWGDPLDYVFYVVGFCFAIVPIALMHWAMSTGIKEEEEERREEVKRKRRDRAKAKSQRKKRKRKRR